MNKSYVIAGLVLVAALFCAAFPVFAAEKESTFDRVLRTGEIRCAYAPAYPYITKETVSEDVVGPTADIFRDIADSLGLKVLWVAEVGFADFAEGFKTGRYDAFCGVLTATAPRSRVAAFTVPVVFIAHDIFVRENETRFKNLEDLNQPDVKAAVTDGESFQYKTRKYLPRTQEHSLPNMTPPAQLLMDVADGKADLVMHDSVLVPLYNEQNPDKKLKPVLTDPLEVNPNVFAVPLGEQDFLNMLNTALLSMQNMGEIEKIFVNHGLGGRAVHFVAKPYAAGQ